MPKNKPKSEFVCEFCKKGFVKEESLINHSCIKRMRWNNKDHPHNVIAFETWQYFYIRSGISKNKKRTYRDFVDSKYFADFARFGKFVSEHKMTRYHEYLDYLIKNSVKLKDWYAESTYQSYIKQRTTAEDPSTAVERSLEYIISWSLKNDTCPQDYFKDVSPNRAVHDILYGNISPWLLYISDNGASIFDKLDSHQLELIKDTVNPPVWRSKIRRNKDTVDELNELLSEYGF